jgi:hypothetical protein
MSRGARGKYMVAGSYVEAVTGPTVFCTEMWVVAGEPSSPAQHPTGQ